MREISGVRCVTCKSEVSHVVMRDRPHLEMSACATEDRLGALHTARCPGPVERFHVAELADQ